MSSRPPASTFPEFHAGVCDVCGSENIAHARGLKAWCPVHAPAYAYAIPKAPIDPQERAAFPPPTATRRPGVGAQVLYTVPSGPARGEDRPAIVVSLLADAPGVWLPIALFVFHARSDGLASGPTEAGYSAAPVAGHWRWP